MRLQTARRGQAPSALGRSDANRCIPFEDPTDGPASIELQQVTRTQILVIKILEITFGKCADFTDRWSALGIESACLPRERLSQLSDEYKSTDEPYPNDGAQGTSFMFDAVLIHCPKLRGHRHRYTGEIVTLAAGLRKLPKNYAMPDGRRWRTLPIIALMSRAACESLSQLLDKYPPRKPSAESGLWIATYEGDVDGGASIIRDAVQADRLSTLAEFDDLGFIVQYERGRYRLGTALKPRDGLFGRYSSNGHSDDSS